MLTITNYGEDKCTWCLAHGEGVQATFKDGLTGFSADQLSQALNDGLNGIVERIAPQDDGLLADDVLRDRIAQQVAAGGDAAEQEIKQQNSLGWRVSRPSYRDRLWHKGLRYER